VSRQLRAGVAALNTANEYLNEMAPQLAGDFRSLLGVRIVDASGEPVPLIARLLDPLHRTESVQVYPVITPEALTLTVKIKREVPGKGDLSVHRTASILVGEIREGVLENLPPLVPRRTDYTAEEIMTKMF
jgi:hypothetical protein